MPTIGNALADIERFQDRLSQAGVRSWFPEQLMNFTSVLFFEFSSHALLESSRERGAQGALFSKYIRLSENQILRDEYVRQNSIGHLFVVWIFYEKYLRDKYFEITGRTEFKISKLFKKLINALELENFEVIYSEFEVIRNTRNSLHDGGCYNRTFSYFEADFKDTTYVFEPGEQVVPLRVMDVCDVMYSHYLKLERLKECS
ncbi:hypothetical protein MED297_20657 [Reinekea sp. MED297]|uniref:Cthe-2314-like HEPN domain-containing protein n=2 Tax=Reinekea TaxID=230494 RepID=A4B9N6_9GAMM|nr:hypothetical protein MED297_20657 [Reinekea sp. MED297] [Reinekea blandensis MED297]